MPKKKILITSALPYANGPLHFGHIAGAYLPGDCYARFSGFRKMMFYIFAARMNMELLSPSVG